MRKIIFLIVLASSVFAFAGCKSGGGGGSGDYASTSGVVYGVIPDGGGDDGGGDDGDPVVDGYHNPEPATMIMFGIGLSGLGAAAWRKRRRK